MSLLLFGATEGEGMAPTFVTTATATTASGTTLTVTKPASVQDNDYMLVHIQHGTGNLAADPTAPSGWTLVGTRQANSSTTGWFYEKFASSEPSSWDWTNFSSGAIFGGISVSRGVDQTTPRHQTHILMNTSISGTSVALTVTTTITDCLLVAFAGQDQTAAGATYTQASMTEDYDGDFTAALLHCGAYHETATTATTYARTISYTAERCCGALFAIAPSSGTTVTFDQATETDTALSLASTKTATLGQSTETDTALALSPTKVLVLGIATEADEAFAVGTSSGVTFELGMATETDTALALTLTKATSLSMATETDEARVLAAGKAASLGQATETDSAAVVSALKALTLGQPTETDAAFTIVVSKTRVLGMASESDEAFALVLTEPRDIVVIAQLRSDHITGAVALTDVVPGLRSSHITGGVNVPRNMLTGSVEYVTAEVTFVGETAAGIASVTGQVQITTTDTTPPANDPNWANADVTERTDSLPVGLYAILALKKLHTAGAAGEYRVYAKVTDNPEIPILKCGSFTVR